MKRRTDKATQFGWRGQILVIMIILLSGPLSAQVLDTTLQKVIEKPGFIESDLNKAVPEQKSVLPGTLPKNEYLAFKDKFYRESKLHIRYSIGYSNVFMWASSVTSGADVAAGGFFQFELESTLFNYKKDFQGGLVVAFTNNHLYGSAASPALLALNTGSLIAHDPYLLPVDWIFPNLYWEQWFKKDRFFIRVGQHNASAMIDFSRYADFRTSISNSGAAGLPVTQMPLGPPAMGISMKLLPKRARNGFYAVAHFSDINSDINRVEIGNFFSTGDFFSAVEVGRNWARMGASGPELDHIHLTVFYADEPSEKLFPSDSGFGFKVAGEKQIGPWVGIANYTYNEAFGGGFGFTTLEHVANAGLAYTNPFGIKGEAMFLYSWAKAQDREFSAPFQQADGSSQSLIETYWKVLLLPEFWVTPGMQFVFGPPGNPNTDLLWVPTLKTRWSF